VSQPLLLDASAWLAAIDTDDRFHDPVRRLLSSAADGTTTLAALDLTLYEVANVATVSWRSPGDADALVRLVLVSCPTTLAGVDRELLADATAIATTNRLTVYDGAYVSAARRHGWTLVSGDLHDLVRPGLAVSPDGVLGDGSA
jgi:predicted nucleic acid-binding protein